MFGLQGSFLSLGDVFLLCPQTGKCRSCRKIVSNGFVSFHSDWGFTLFFFSSFVFPPILRNGAFVVVGV